MPLNMKEARNKAVTGSRPDPIEEGTYPARVVQVIDMGVQPTTDFKTGKVTGHAPQLRITFELPTETITIEDEEKPRWLSKQYKLSFHEKANLTALIKSVGKDPDKMESLEELLTRPCMVTVGMTENGNNKITGTSKLVKGMKVDALVNTAVAIDYDDPDPEVIERLPDFIKEGFQKAEGYEGSRMQEVLEGESDTSEEKDDEDEDESEETEELFDD